MLPGVGHASDLSLFRTWSLTLAQYGPGGYYAHAGFADYPPGYLWFLWPIGLLAQLESGLLHVPAADAVMGLLKLPAIFGDVIAAGVAYRVVGRSSRAGLVAAAIFLVNPVAWYDSTVWGQVDVIGALFLFGALVALNRRWSEAAAALAVLATLIKVQLGIGLFIVAVVLLRRHLLARDAGPPRVPRAGIAAEIGDIVRDLSRRRGPIRLVSSAVVALVAGLAVVLPFDLQAVAGGGWAGVPVIGQLAGLMTVVGNAATYYDVLTVNAFNGWALTGPDPLATTLSAGVTWTLDSYPIFGPVPAVVFGLLSFVLVAAAVAWYLIRQPDEGRTVFVAATVLAVAFFMLPTRVHERYLFPAFVLALPLAATSMRWRSWYAATAAAAVLNLHAILTLPDPGFASPATVALPFGAALRTPIAITAIVAINGIAFAWAIWQLRPAFETRPRPSRDPSTLGDAQQTLWDAHALGPLAPAPSPAWDAGPPAGRDFAGRRAIRAPVTSLVGQFFAPLASRVAAESRLPSREHELDREPHGTPDRRDAAIVAGLFLLIVLSRSVGLGRPVTMYFDEIYHPLSGMEFLQSWRYGMPHAISETTHPHVAKYIDALAIAALGDNRATVTPSVGTSVTTAAIDPSGPDPRGAGRGRLVVVNDHGIAVRPIAGGSGGVDIPMRGATSVAIEGNDIVVGTAGGDISVLTPQAIAQGVAPAPFANVAGPVTGIWPSRAGLIVRVKSTMLVLGPLGQVARRIDVPGFRSAIVFPNDGRDWLALATDDGLVLIDPESKNQTTIVPINGGATSVAFIDGSEALYRARDMFTQPALYVVNGTSTLGTFTLPPGGSILPTGVVSLPGPVTDLRWNRATDLVHLLGRTPSGAPTIYVLEPTSNAVFADAALPFDPIAWGLDVVPESPDMDREAARVIAADGRTAAVNIGGNAFAWRLPGVIAGGVMAVAVYLLLRLLFRRRTVALFTAGAMAIDGLLFAQSRVGMNDTYVGAFIAVALLLLAALSRAGTSRRMTGLVVGVGLPVLGIVLGLALATKWVGAYAMGAAVLIMLAASALGRALIVAGFVALTAVFGYLAVADSPPNVTFAAIMIGLTALAALAAARTPGALGRGEVEYITWLPLLAAGATWALVVLAGPDRVAAALPPGPQIGPVQVSIPLAIVLGLILVAALTRAAFAWAAARGTGPLADTAEDRPLPVTGRWRDPRWLRGIPFTWAIVCLTVVPLVVYVATYIPWAVGTPGGPQLFPGWPPGHTGQTLLQLQADMYRYHNELRTPHASASPWWAWPLDLKPIWGYDEVFGDTEATWFATGNVVLFWLGVPAAAFGIWQAWRRRHAGLGFVVVAFLALWLPWSRIDRVAFQYHWYVALPLYLGLLGYLAAELWHGPSSRTWRFAKLACAGVLLLPGLLWMGKGAVCTIAGVPDAAAESACAPNDAVAALVSTAYVLVAAAIAWFVILPAQRPRTLVAGVGAIAALFFVLVLPLDAAMALPGQLAIAYQGLLPTWPVTFQFGSNTLQAATVSVASAGTLAMGALASVVAVAAFEYGRRGRRAVRRAQTPAVRELAGEGSTR